MSKQVYFYNSNDGDREYDANSMTDWLKPFFTTGVFNGDMKVGANGDMSVVVATGYANINGKVIKLEKEETLWIETASGTLNRIDNVVLRRNDINRDITIEVVKGTEASKPVAPELERSEHIYEIKLAEISVNMGVIKITQEHIRDTRMDSSVCGWVAQTVKEIDLSQLPAQFEAKFETWFEEIKGQLSTDVAGNLQTQLMTERARIDELVAQKGVEAVDGLTLAFSGEKTTCTSIKVISNGICAELHITNLKWQQNSIKTYDTIAIFPENLLPLTQSKEGEGTRQVIYDADDIQIMLRDNRLQVYRKEGATPKNHTCMVLYALKNPSMAEISDVRIGVNGKVYSSAGAAVRAQIEDVQKAMPSADEYEYRDYVMLGDGSSACVVVVGEDAQIGEKVKINKISNEASIRYTRTDGAFGSVYFPTVNPFEMDVTSDAMVYTITGCEVYVPKKMHVADLNEKVANLEVKSRTYVIDLEVADTRSIPLGNEIIKAFLDGRAIIVKDNSMDESSFVSYYPVTAVKLPSGTSGVTVLYIGLDGEMKEKKFSTSIHIDADYNFT